MLDTMTMTKVTASLCGSLLIFLFGTWGAESIYHMGASHGHGDDHHQAYKIDTGDDDHGGDAVVEQGPDFAELMAAADVGKGERVFGKCKACHKVGPGENGTGPTLYQIVDRGIGDLDGFGYSNVLASNDEPWTVENLNGFIENPKGWAQGTKMSFAGIKKPTDRANLIAYLATLQ